MLEERALAVTHHPKDLLESSLPVFYCRGCCGITFENQFLHMTNAFSLKSYGRHQIAAVAFVESIDSW